MRRKRMDRYQALTRIALNNWHYINRKILSFHQDINFFTGHSGSGKSTVLDAIQVVLYADTNGRNFFNKAAKEDSDRTLIEYLRGMKNVQDNGVSAYLRNSNFSSTIVLEFEDTQTKEYQCIGVAFDVDTATNDINRLFFRHTGRLLENEYRSEDRVLTSSEVRDYLKSHFEKDKIYYGRTNEAFRSKLYDEFFGGLDERKFVSLFKRAIPFKMDTKLEDFVKEYICMEQDIHIDDMQESVTQYVRLKRRLEEIKLEIQSLTQIKEQYAIFHAISKQRKQDFYNGNRLQLLYLQEEIQTATDKKIAYEEGLKDQIEKQKKLEAELSFLSKERDAVIIAIENSGYSHLEKEITSFEKELEHCEKSKKIWDHLGESLNCWKEKYFFETDFVNQMKEFASYQIDNLTSLQEGIRSHREATEEQKVKALEKIGRIRSEIEFAQREQKSLANGKKVYPSYVLEVKAKLEEGLHRKYGKIIPVEILADAIDVADDTWRDAVEGYMGNNKLALLVEPDYTIDAMEIYQSLDFNKYYKAAVIDTKRMLENKREALKGSLSEEVVTNATHVRAYVDYLMGNVIKCGSMDELRKHKAGITKDCMLYQGYKLQHINPKNYSEQAYIGSKAMEKKMDVLKEKVALLEKEKEPFETTLKECNRILSFEKLELEHERYTEYLADIKHIPEINEQIDHLKLRIQELKEKNIDEWRAKKELLDQNMKSKNLQKDTTLKAISSYEANQKKANEDFLSFQEALIEKQKNFKVDLSKEAAYEAFMAKSEGELKQKLMNQCFLRSEKQKEKEEAEYVKLTKVREEYAKSYSYRGFSITTRDNKEYAALLENLQSEKLSEFMEKANLQAKVAVSHFKTDFIYKIRDAIKEAMQQKDDLNRVLSKLDFGKDRYHFVITKSRGEEGKFYDMFMDENLEINPSTLSDQAENQMNFFSMEHQNKYNDYINELLDLFMPPETVDAKALEDARINLEKYADYRTYLSFDMEQRVEGMPVMRLSKMLSKNSGGEGQNPLYVALLASFAQIYRITMKENMRRRPTFRLVVLDEAFSKMDAEKVGSCIGLIRKLGVQAIISATNDKIQNYVDNVDKTFVFANPNKTNISIQEFERQEFDLLTKE